MPMSKNILKINSSPKTLEEAIAVIQQLIGMVVELKQENAELKEKLRINSKNSSLPPSKDLRKPKNKKKTSGHKQGGQPGHKGVFRSLLPETEVNEIIDCPFSAACGACEGEVVLKKIKRHQVYELPKQQFEVIEYRKHIGVCSCCYKKYEGSYPSGVTEKMLGPRTHGLIGLLTSKYRLSKRLVVELFHQVYGLSISLGTVSNVESTISMALNTPYEDIKANLTSVRVVHLNETGHKEKNKNGWAWLMGSNEATLFSLHRSRGRKVAKSLINSYINRIFITDRYPVYDYLPDANRQVCWAHLKRDFQKISEREGVCAKIGFGLLKAYQSLFTLWKKEPLVRRLYHKKTKQWFRRYTNKLLYWLKQGSMRGHKNTARTCEKLLEIEPALWTFWWDGDVPPTNNQAERQLRPLVISKKLTFGTQSSRGSRFIERIFSMVMTCQQQKKNIFEYLEECMFALFANQPTPKLLQA